MLFRSVKHYVIDFSEIADRNALHTRLKHALELPEYYGRNLDALYDCLTEMPECTVTLISSDALSSLGQYGKAVLSVFSDAAASSNITLIIK